MNLYDRDDGFRRFSLKEANDLLPRIIKKTEYALSELEELRQQAEESGLEFSTEDTDSASGEVLERWSQAMVSLGVYPKGYFTVDFKSPIPDTLFCWTYGEDEITHTHKVYESFKDRRPISDRKIFGFEHSLN